MLDNGYLFANDNKRLFINSSLGCSGACSYCYLPKFKYDNQNEVEKVLSANEIIELIDKSGYKVLPTTLITIGCFSECMDRQNKKSTLDLIKYFLKNGNQVQISTKQFISYEDIKDIIPLIKYYGQFIIFVSSTTISQQGIYERNTTNVEKRFKNFELTNFKIPVVLYLKPILKDVTIKDISMYKSYIKKYKIKYIVVGSMFTEKESAEKIHFSNEVNLFYNKVNDEDEIVNLLKNDSLVFRKSSEVCNYFIR